MFKPIRASTEELTELINHHLDELLETDAAWQILDSPISGRGIFATRNIAAGEIILRERALLSAPTANLSSKLNTCCVCYCRLEGKDEEIMCQNGCTLPVCNSCCNSNDHIRECQLFCQWHPRDKRKINRYTLRLVCIARSTFLSELQLKLLYALQANPDKYYMLEIQKAANGFENFPKAEVKRCYRIACAINTNTFEGSYCMGDNEVFIRALFPLAGLLNHQCTPNVNHHLANDKTMIVTAVRAIAKGEEIVTSYTKVLWSTLARKVFLAMTKKFICVCNRCMDPTKCFENVPMAYKAISKTLKCIMLGTQLGRMTRFTQHDELQLL